MEREGRAILECAARAFGDPRIAGAYVAPIIREDQIDWIRRVWTVFTTFQNSL